MNRAFISILSERNKLIIYFESEKNYLKTYFVHRVVELSNFTWVFIVTTPAFKKNKGK